MELELVLVNISVTTLWLGFIALIIRLFDALILKPKRLRSRLQKQGIQGPPSSFLLGNLRDLKKTRLKGSTFMFSMGNTQILHLSSPELLKEISTSTSLDYGRPPFLQKAVEPLLGQGIVAANGALWANQRKSLLLNSIWKGSRYLPIKINRETRRLEKEIRTLILKVVKEREEGGSEQDLLQMILEGAKSSHSGQDAKNRFIVDNCKNIYLSGYETSAVTVTATLTLMLLALYTEWQEKVREEILEICRGELPNADMLLKMKTLTMVINEVLRLYLPVSLMTREALEDIKLGDINVPKGVNLWIMVVTLHQDPNIWGPDADEFNPERFASGVTGACKFAHVYMPFGTGSHTCLGQYFAMAELKILFALLLSNFRFSLSPRYKHSPSMNLNMEPQYGVDLLIRKL
ncbi:hypothetical protein CRYUN_Cryun09bG0077200 [Craigia yunnanensis]